MARSPDSASSPFGWLLQLPPYTERALRMEALISRLRLVVVAVGTFALLFLIDTSGMHLRWAWGLITFSWIYGLPVAVLEPYKRWQVFRASLASAILDSLAIAGFVAATGAADSPFYLLYYLSVAAVAMRFDLRQALAACGFYAATYAVVYFLNWDGSLNAFGELYLRLAYMLILSVAVGHLAREEFRRSQEVDQIEQLNAENQRLVSRTERAARYDKLTGLLNRAYFEKDFKRDLRRARSSHGYLSVLFCDMDRLKKINDELGHDYGDRILKQVAAALKRELRSGEQVGRYGGDEFVILLPNLTRESAFERGERFVEAVQSLNYGMPDHLQVGLSIGVATCPFDAQEGALLLKLADQAMYLAKREGGNRVRTANDLRMFWEEMPRIA